MIPRQAWGLPQLFLGVFTLVVCANRLAGADAQTATTALVKCAEAAADWWQGRPGIAFEDIDAATAVPVCEGAAREQPDSKDAWAFLARALAKAGRYSEAQADYERSLAIDAKAHRSEQPALAADLHSLGIHAYGVGRYAAAQGYFERALAIQEQVHGPEHLQVAQILSSLGTTAATLGQYTVAQDYYRRELAIHEKVYGPEHQEVASVLNNLGGNADNLGQYAAAQGYYQRALAISEKVYGPEHSALAIVLNNLGVNAANLGQYAVAQGYYERARAIREKVYGPEHPYVATALNNLGFIASALGQYTEAQGYYERSLAIDLLYGPERPEVAIALSNLGANADELGQYAAAQGYYERVLAIREKVYGPEHPEVANALSNLGATAAHLGQYAAAQGYYERALAIDLKVYGPEHPEVALVLNNLGVNAGDNGQYAAAHWYFERVLAIREKVYGPEHPELAGVLFNLGTEALNSGQLTMAQGYYKRALVIVAEYDGKLPIEADVNFGLSGLFYASGESDLAVVYGKRAVNAVQALRRNVVALDRETQQAFLNSREDFYQRLADRLIEAGRLPEAQQVLGMLKEEEFFDFVRRDERQADGLSTQASFTTEELAWEQRYQQARGRLAAIGAELRALETKPPVERSAADERRIKALAADRAAAQQAFRQNLEDLRMAFTRPALAERQAAVERVIEFAQKDLKSLGALQATLGRLGPGVVALHYLLLDDKLRILVTTPDLQLHRDSPIGAKALNPKIFAYRQTLQQRRDPLPEASELYDLVLRPVAGDLRQVGATLLLVSLDDTLRYLPISALHDGQGYVAERYPIVVYTPAAGSNLERSPTAQWTAAGFGLTRPVGKFAALPAVADELRGIVRERGVADSRGVLNGEVKIDQAFTTPALSASLRERYPVVHIASHFVFKPGVERDSFLVLGDGSPLTLDVLRDLPFEGVDLLTLSACETAMDGRQANGREVEGFGALAQRQGAGAVMATLWPVSDVGTAQLMTRFYALRETDRLNKAEALQQAQREFIRGPAAAEPDAAQSGPRGLEFPADVNVKPRPVSWDLAHPYYWAPFILMGNWL